MINGSVRNPVIIACLIGAGLNLSDVGLPAVIGPFMLLIGKAALPLGLMAVGAGLDFRSLSARRGVLTGTAAVKLIVMPFLTWVLCLTFGVEGISAVICIIFAALPVSATSYVMARQMGGDGQLMAGIVTSTTLAAALTLPIVIALFQ